MTISVQASLTKGLAKSNCLGSGLS